MKTTNLKQTSVAKPRKWFQRRRPWHDPMLVLNMSIFNFDGGWRELLLKISPKHMSAESTIALVDEPFGV